MPASVPVACDGNAPHDSYRILLKQHAHGPLLGVPCPRCPPERGAADLALTTSTVRRPVKLLQLDEHAALVIVRVVIAVGLARCRRCRGRFRVLPCNVVARKHYGLGAIEHAVREYAKGDRGLRPVVWELHGEAPAHTTLRAWTEGLGDYAQGRPAGEVAEALPASRVVAEAESRHASLAKVRRAPVKVNPARYRSRGRRERLAACARFVRLATALVAQAGGVPAGSGATTTVASSLVEWSRLILRWCRSSPIGFRSGRPCTRSKRIIARLRRPCCPTEEQEELACRIPSRSRSGATSRSPP